MPEASGTLPKENAHIKRVDGTVVDVRPLADKYMGFHYCPEVPIEKGTYQLCAITNDGKLVVLETDLIPEAVVG